MARSRSSAFQRTVGWASQIFGEIEQYETQNSTTTTAGNGSTSHSVTASQQLVKRELVLPSQFLSLPATNRANGLSGYFISSYVGAFFSTLMPEYLDETLLPPADNEPGFIPRPAEQQYLKPWTAADLRRLNLEGLLDADSAASPQAPSDSPPADKRPLAPDPQSLPADPPSKPDLNSVRRVQRHRQD